MSDDFLKSEDFAEWDRKRTEEENRLSRRRFLGMAAGAVGGASVLGALGSSGARAAQSLFESKGVFIVADWGGNTAAVRARTIGAKFTQLTGVPVQETAIDYGKLQAQVQSHHVTWNWSDDEAWFTFAHPELFIDFPYKQVGLKKSEIYPIPNSWTTKGALSYHSCYAIGYRTDSKLKAPSNWVEFFDTNNFPGKRALYNWPYGTLEIALIADGVPYKQLYPLDLARAFKKIDSIKSDLVFWNTGAESQQFLVSQAADFVQGWHNRMAYLAVGGLPVNVNFGQNLQILTHNSITKYQPNVHLNIEWMKAAYDPHALAQYATESLNSPPGPPAYKLLDAPTKKWMSTNPVNLRQTVGVINDPYWGKNFSSIEKQWYAHFGH
jgi:putative spermidine/putrescine transport system substrate-binding protein